MATLKKLQKCTNLSDVANLLGVAPKHLSYVLYKTELGQKYTEFKIPKKAGGSRLIHAPTKKLKFLQSRLSDILYECERTISPKPENPLRVYSHAFQKKRDLSIVSNAGKHVGRKHILNIDLKDFFPSINFGRVRGYFIKNRNYKLNEAAATVLAQIICRENSLPQGGPTSPIISEMITSILDLRLAKLAKKNGCTYSRYADDITFSTNKLEFPQDIAMDRSTRLVAKIKALVWAQKSEWAPSKKLTEIIERSGFEVNSTKTRMLSPRLRQSVTGLVVNEKVNVTSEFSKTTRWMCHSLTTTGKAYIKLEKSKIKEPVSLNQLEGRISFLYHIKSGSSERKSISQMQSDKVSVPTFYKVYQNFLFYKKFHVNQKPLIICEGETDNIYIKCAIRALYLKYPLLAQKPDVAKTPPTLNVDFFNYRPTTAQVMNLSGGSGELPKLAYSYSKILSKFHKGGQTAPVIILVDNDKASEGMWTAIKSLSQATKPIDGSKNFYHVARNLFVVPIPKIGTRETLIEDLFTDALRKTKFEGKKFKPVKKKKERLKDDEYGKMVFAKKVVAKNTTTIDFSGFEPLLSNLSSVLAVKLDASE